MWLIICLVCTNKTSSTRGRDTLSWSLACNYFPSTSHLITSYVLYVTPCAVTVYRRRKIVPWRQYSLWLFFCFHEKNWVKLIAMYVWAQRCINLCARLDDNLISIIIFGLQSSLKWASSHCERSLNWHICAIAFSSLLPFLHSTMRSSF